MTTFLLSRASSISRASSYPLTTPKFHNKVKQTHQDARSASRRGRMAQKSSASGDDYASLQYMLGDEGGVG